MRSRRRFSPRVVKTIVCDKSGGIWPSTRHLTWCGVVFELLNVFELLKVDLFFLRD